VQLTVKGLCFECILRPLQDSEMLDLYENREIIYIESCFNLMKPHSQIYETRSKDMSEVQTLEWYSSFKCGQTVVQDFEHSFHQLSSHP
jgi:hypothetical protein